jgi:hypothetical protein
VNVWGDKWESYNVLLKLMPKTIFDFGTAFVVAAVVSGIFDIAFHESVFGKPIRRIEESMSRLLTTVGSLNSILKSAYDMNIGAIYKRQGSLEMHQWQTLVEKTVIEAEEFIYMAGRTLAELFPTRREEREQDISHTIKKKLQQEGIKEIKIVTANVFNLGTTFKQECKERAREENVSPNSLWQPGKDTVEQLLRMKYRMHQNKDGDETKLHLRISNDSIPFSLVMTEKILIVQHYLPYVEGRYGVVMNIMKAAEHDANLYNLYNLYKHSYGRLYSKAEGLQLIYQEYVKRKPVVREKISDLLQYLGVD